MRKYFHKFLYVWTEHLSPNISKKEKFIYAGIGLVLTYVAVTILFAMMLN